LSIDNASSDQPYRTGRRMSRFDVEIAQSGWTGIGQPLLFRAHVGRSTKEVRFSKPDINVGQMPQS
ncbi:MAG: hypothetical protein ABSD11_21535, partial [Methylocella sp.]